MLLGTKIFRIKEDATTTESKKLREDLVGAPSAREAAV